jgi:hypothetical protein
MEELKKEKLDCFKLCFRVKVADAIYFEQLKAKEREWLEKGEEGEFKDTEEYKEELNRIITETKQKRTFIISFIKSSPELYDAI